MGTGFRRCDEISQHSTYLLTINKHDDRHPCMANVEQTVALIGGTKNSDAELLDRVFFALSDPVRRAILERLGEEALLVSELAAPFDISLQAVSRHIQVLVRDGLVWQSRHHGIHQCRQVA